MTDELTTVYINGDHVPVAEASVSVFDSGFNFGDGVFEGIRVYQGAVLFLPDHLTRLYQSAAAIYLDVPMTPQRMKQDILDWLRANDITDGFHFRPIVTRGIRHPPRVDPRFIQGGPTVVFVGAAVAPASSAGVRCVFTHHRRPSPDMLDSKIKSISYLPNVLAKLDALRQGADDALVFDSNGYLAEATVANVFLVRRGRLMTPAPTACLEGVTRRLVIDIAESIGIAVEERNLTSSDLFAADEVFLCGTGAEINHVVSVQGRSVGDGQRGPLTAQLLDAYHSAIPAHGTRIDESC